MAEYLGLAVGLAEFALGIADRIQAIHKSYKSADKTLLAISLECRMLGDDVGHLRGQKMVESQMKPGGPIVMLLDKCNLTLSNLEAEISKIDKQQGGWGIIDRGLRFLLNEAKLKELLQELREQRNMLSFFLTGLIVRHLDSGSKLAVTTDTQVRGPSPSHPNRPGTERRSTEAIAKGILGRRTFMKPPLSQEGLVVAVSDSENKYERVGNRVRSTVHTSAEKDVWVITCKRIQSVCSKRHDIATGEIEILLHVRPQIALNPQKGNTLFGVYEGPDRELVQPIQLCGTEVGPDAPIDYGMEQDTPLLIGFPKRTKVFCLSQPGFGAAGAVLDASKTTLSVSFRHYPWDPRDNQRFKQLIAGQTSTAYYPMPVVAEMIGVSLYALTKLTSRLLIISPDNRRINIGLSLKFEYRKLKVVHYSRKLPEQEWELSEKAVRLCQEYKSRFPDIFLFADREWDGMAPASEFFPGPDMAMKMKMVTDWLGSKGVHRFRSVALHCDGLPRETIAKVEKQADRLAASRHGTHPTTITVDLPRQAVLRPRDAASRLQYQDFALGDRIALVKGTEDFLHPIEGTVVDLNPNSIDVIWDVPNKLGTTLHGRCSPQRGSTVGFSHCLNLTNPQFVYPTPPTPRKW
ncbi:hypothetical protein BD779DRAFT_1539869 [Infundibulicybe gibba]|nr:hypothetical protein BD779DRAFT_1539869 [Infundibulicybe gibba]